MGKNALQLCLIITVLLAPYRLWAGPYGFRKYSFFTFLEAGYFNSNKNFDDSGNTVQLPLNNYLAEFKSNLLTSYDITNNWGIYNNLSFKREEAYGTTVSRTNANFSDISLGSDYLVWSRYFNVIPDCSFSFAPYAKPGTDDGALMGDGATTFTTRLHLSKVFQDFAFAGYGGFKFRGDGLSTQVPWGLSTHYEIELFFFEALLSGLTSLNNDQYTNTPQTRQSVTNNINAGSLLYYVVNPNSTNLTGRVGWKVESNIFITVGVEQTIAGQRSAQGTRYILGIGVSDLIGGGTTRLKELHNFMPVNGTDEVTIDTKMKSVGKPRSKSRTEIDDEESLMNDMSVKRVKLKGAKPITPIR